MAKKNTTQNDRLTRLLTSLDPTWAKLGVIGAIAFVGFKFGCYYQETQSIRSGADRERNLIDELYRLKEENLKLREKNSLQIIQIEQLKQHCLADEIE